MGIQKRLMLVIVVAALYAAHFTVFPLWLAAGIRLLGYPAYEGFVGITLPHILLYSTPLTVAAAVSWWIFVRMGWMEWGILKRLDGRAILIGIFAGLAALALSLAFMRFAAPDSLGWIPPNAWKILGNLFSNFYEEFVFRGFFLVALTAAVGFWPAAVATALGWALTHSQYPLELKLLIAVIGVGWSWVVQQTKSLWSAYVAHDVLDFLGDSLIG